MKEKAKNIFLIFLCLMFIGYLLGTGIYDLVNTKDLHSVNIDGCVEILEIEHSINGLIPVGTDHYYLGFDEDGNSAFLIKASKRWYSKNFNEQGDSNTPGGLDITALAKKVSDFDVREELLSRVSQLEGSGVDFPVSPEYSLEIDYKIRAMEKLALLVLGGIIAFIVFKISRSDTEVSGTVKKITLVVSIVFLILLLKVLI